MCIVKVLINLKTTTTANPQNPILLLVISLVITTYVKVLTDLAGKLSTNIRTGRRIYSLQMSVDK